MRVVVDANILFSAILNVNSRISNLLLNSSDFVQFIAPEFLRVELQKHRQKIISIAGYTEIELEEIQFQIFKRLHFVPEEIIDQKFWNHAFAIVEKVDPKDAPYVALALEHRLPIWSGDKQLMNGISAVNEILFVTTNELYILREQFRMAASDE